MAAVASGMTMRLIPRTNYVFDKVNNGTQTILLCQHIDVSVFQEASFLVRAHSGSINATTSLVFNVLADGWTLEDPSLQLTSATNSASTALGTATIANSFPAYYLVDVPVPSGRLLSVSLVATQPAASAACNAAISIDLTLKSGDPTALPLDYNTYRGYRI